MHRGALPLSFQWNYSEILRQMNNSNTWQIKFNNRLSQVTVASQENLQTENLEICGLEHCAAVGTHWGRRAGRSSLEQRVKTFSTFPSILPDKIDASLLFMKSTALSETVTIKDIITYHRLTQILPSSSWENWFNRNFKAYLKYRNLIFSNIQKKLFVWKAKWLLSLIQMKIHLN